MWCFYLLATLSFVVKILCNNFEIQNNVLLNDTPGKVFNELTMLECAFSCNQINSTYANSNVDDKVVMGRGKCHCFQQFNESLVEHNEDWHLLLPFVLPTNFELGFDKKDIQYTQWGLWSPCKGCQQSETQTRERRCNIPDCDISLLTETRNCKCIATRIFDASRRFCFTSDPNQLKLTFNPMKLERINSSLCDSLSSWFIYNPWEKKFRQRNVAMGIWICVYPGSSGNLVTDNGCASKKYRLELTPWNTLMAHSACIYAKDAEVGVTTVYGYERYAKDAEVGVTTVYGYERYGGEECLKSQNRIYFDKLVFPATVNVDYYQLQFDPYDIETFKSLTETTVSNYSGSQPDFKFDFYMEWKYQARIRSYFVPPHDANYYFTMCCGYKCQFYINMNPGKNPADNVTLLLENNKVVKRSKCTHQNMLISNAVNLQFANLYYIEALLIGDSKDSYMKIGVTSLLSPKFSSLPEILNYYLVAFEN